MFADYHLHTWYGDDSDYPMEHFDAGFTLRTYTHVTTKMQEQAADTMGQFIAQNM